MSEGEGGTKNSQPHHCGLWSPKQRALNELTAQIGTPARRVYVRQRVLDEYGRTLGCAGCLRVGAHSENCSERVEKEMVDAGAHSRRAQRSKLRCC